MPEASGIFSQRRGTNAKTELRIIQNGEYNILDEVRLCIPDKNDKRTTYAWTETGKWTISGNEILLIPATSPADKRFGMFRRLFITKSGNNTVLIYNGKDAQLKKYVHLKKNSSQETSTSRPNE